MRCGFVALLGRPNVGKSSLLNALTGEELSITSPRPETTRDRLLAVVHRPGAQLVLLDTPGLHESRHELGAYMNDQARRAASDADVLALVVDATEGEHSLRREAPGLELVSSLGKPAVLVLNKVDALPSREAALPLIEAWSKAREWTALVPLSATKGEGLEVLLEALAPLLPEGEALFPEDALTDRPLRYLCAEKVREAVLAETGQEVPYGTAVELEQFDGRAPTPHVRATIHVERDGQKKIVVGQGGSRIKAIGTRARAGIEALLGRKVFLELWVKVTPEWTRSRESLARLGYALPKEPGSERKGAPRSTRAPRRKPSRG